MNFPARVCWPSTAIPHDERDGVSMRQVCCEQSRLSRGESSVYLAAAETRQYCPSVAISSLLDAGSH